LQELGKVIRSADIKGERYAEAFAAINLGDTPEDG